MNFPELPKQSVNQLKKALDNFKYNDAIELCTNEAQTRKFLIEPFFEILNYASNDLIPEYSADFGERISQKIDYAILLNKKDIILVEAKKHNSKLTDKEAGQLNGYFGNTKNSKIGILTNGTEYRFYSDVVQPNLIDSKPFFIFNITSYSESDLDTLIKFDKRYIKVIEIVKTAQEVVFIESFESSFFNELATPSKDLLKLIFKNMSFKTKPFNDEIQIKLIKLFNSSLLKSMYERKLLLEVQSNSQGIITTEIEIQAYHIIRTLLIQNKKIPKERIGYRDFKGFFNICIDDSTQKVICKLNFNNSNMKITIESNEFILENIDDLLKYKNHLTDRTLKIIE
jgi:hypothetical protein